MKFDINLVLKCSFVLLIAKSAFSKEWETWIQSGETGAPAPIIQTRAVNKAGKFQLSSSVGFSERRDFFNTWVLGLGARYHFNETHGWEVARFSWSFPGESDLAREIRETTSFRPDSQSSRFQFSSAYIFSPIYGKYAWNEDSLVHFDVFTTIGGGVRFARDRQPYLELGLGSSHYVLGSHLSIVPELRLRGYKEARTNSTFVTEAVLQVGASWLF